MNELQQFDRPLTGTELIAQVNQVQEIMKAVMKENEHFGKIPGCGDKPTLLKAGAEKIALAFRFRTQTHVEPKEIFGSPIQGHREYQVTVDIITSNGEVIGTGVGCCSTMESKFRFRTGEIKFTDKPVPKAYWDLKASNFAEAQKAIGGRGFSVKKNDSGKYVIVEQGDKVEHENPADYYNTCMKMAKKRAFVDGILTATAASDIFTQDVEDMDFAGKTASAPVAQKDDPIQEPKQKQSSDAGISDKQVSAIQVMGKKLGFDDVHPIINSILQRADNPITSIKQLTMSEASKVIDNFNKAQATATQREPGE